MKRVTGIRLARLKACKSLLEVSYETELPQYLLSLYERGFRPPKPQHLVLLAKAYNCAVEELTQEGV